MFGNRTFYSLKTIYIGNTRKNCQNTWELTDFCHIGNNMLIKIMARKVAIVHETCVKSGFD